MKRNAILKYSLVGSHPTPLSVVEVWPEMYESPVWIVVYRPNGERDYLWSARREAALMKALVGCSPGRVVRAIRPDEGRFEYLVSDEATAAAL